jgi:hypothetical protein
LTTKFSYCKGEEEGELTKEVQTHRECEALGRKTFVIRNCSHIDGDSANGMGDTGR